MTSSSPSKFQFTEVYCNTAQQFMSYLNPQDDFWTEGKYRNQSMRHYIFRGQANSDWQLKPSAWRNVSNINSDKDASDYYDSEIALNNIFRFYQHKYPNRKKAEKLNNKYIMDNLFSSLIHMNGIFQDIIDFMFLANRIGLHIPAFSELSNMSLLDFTPYHVNLLIEKSNNNFVKDIWENESIALAQHHGMKTPLLDWSYNAKKAAYFSIFKPDNNAKHIVVYALCTISIFIYRSFKLINVATSQNDFLRIQEGLFTYDYFGDVFFLENGFYPTLEDCLDEVTAPSYKFILPVTEIKELEYRLRGEGIHLGSIMPTYDNVAKMINEYNWKEVEYVKKL